MKETKRELKFFSVLQWKKEEQYLRWQHKNGWEFEKIRGAVYHFRKCKPEDVIYQLDYHPDSKTRKDEYIQIFEDCGWEYLQNYAGYSYFRKSNSQMDGTEEEIFCDDDSRLEMVKRVFKGRIIPLIIIFLLIIIPNIFNLGMENAAVERLLFVIFCVLFIVYLVLFVSFAVSFWKYYRAAHKG
ncbi:MAG: DUF2812 domain-containing protein [Clostridiales bacterium]|nr:DUF2812 domain-containing protein [Clostridiales bacterium]